MTLGAGPAEQLLDRLGQVADGGGGGLLDEQVARVGVLEGELHQVDRLVQVHQEAGHGRVGHRDRLAGADLLDEQRYDASPGEHMTLP